MGMTQPRLIVWDDGGNASGDNSGGGGNFGPLTDLRASFELRTGAVTTLERIEATLGRKAEALWLRDATLRELLAARHDVPINDDETANADDCLLVNGRWLGILEADAVRKLQPGQALVCERGTLAARLTATEARKLLDTGAMPAGVHTQTVPAAGLIARPWHILDQLETTLPHDLSLSPLPRIRTTFTIPGCQFFGTHALRLAPTVKVQPGVVFNLEAGDIVIDPHTTIAAGSVIEGPCFIGEHTQLAAHSYLRPHTVIGPQCKVAGEISFSIIHGYSNKAHFGYLGHSLVGQFVNLGAGTTVSNLKNTYGQVRMTLRHEGEAQDTGRVFCGPVIGDLTRTAIGSRLLTGSCIATGSMIALSTFAPKSTRPLAFYTDDTPQGQPAKMEKFLATARAMMARRKVELTPALAARLTALARQ